MELTVSLLVLAVFLFAGFLAVRLPLLRKAFLPASLVAGAFLLVLGPHVAGIHFPDWQLPVRYYEQWQALPKELINVVFACLFLARPLLPARKMWRLAGPQVAFGQTMAWGQYLIGGLLALLVLVPLLAASPLSGALIEIAFEGGHGTSAGLEPVFNQLGFAEGRDLALALATTSLTFALICGVLLVNWGYRKHHFQPVRRQTPKRYAYHRRILYELRKQRVLIREHASGSNLPSHLLLIGLAVGFGWLIHQGLLLVEGATWAKADVVIFEYVPLFPLCMFGGMIAHQVWKRLGIVTSRPLVDLISALALTVLIATAVGTMSLAYIVSHPLVFGLLAICGIGWTVLAFVFLAPRIFQEHWFQRGIVDFGQSLGMTATGLLFLQMVDPNDETSAMESFGYKQLLFEPFVGGGLVTALAMPFIFTFGLPAFVALSGVVFVGWLTVGLRYFGRMSVRGYVRRARPSVRPAVE